MSSGASRSIAWHAHSSSIGDDVRAQLERARPPSAPRAHAHADVIFLVAEVGIVSTLAGCASVFSSDVERGRGHLRHHQPRLQAAVARQERRQAAERRVDEPIGSPLADRRQLREAEAEQIGGNADRRAVEVAARDDLARCRRTPSGCRWPRWLRCRTTRRRERERVARRAMHLRRAAHGIGVLHASAVGVRRVDRAAGEQTARDLSADDRLPGERPRAS